MPRVRVGVCVGLRARGTDALRVLGGVTASQVEVWAAALPGLDFQTCQAFFLQDTLRCGGGVLNKLRAACPLALVQVGGGGADVLCVGRLEVGAGHTLGILGAACCTLLQGHPSSCAYAILCLAWLANSLCVVDSGLQCLIVVLSCDARAVGLEEGVVIASQKIPGPAGCARGHLGCAVLEAGFR